jgi:hypothetical protein
VAVTDVTEGVTTVAFRGVCEACPNIAMTYRPGPHLLLRVHGIPELRDAGVHGSPRPRSDREDPGCSRNACMTRFSQIDAHCDAASQAHAAADGLNCALEYRS